MGLDFGSHLTNMSANISVGNNTTCAGDMNKERRCDCKNLEVRLSLGNITHNLESEGLRPKCEGRTLHSQPSAASEISGVRNGILLHLSVPHPHSKLYANRPRSFLPNFLALQSPETVFVCDWWNSSKRTPGSRKESGREDAGQPCTLVSLRLVH